MKDLFITKSTVFTECPYHFPSSRYLRLSVAGYDENRVFPYIIPPIKNGVKTAWIVKIFTVNTVRSCFLVVFHVFLCTEANKTSKSCKIPRFWKIFRHNWPIFSEKRLLELQMLVKPKFENNLGTSDLKFYMFYGADFWYVDTLGE